MRVNRTICIDACVFGGRSTALGYPEEELVMGISVVTPRRMALHSSRGASSDRAAGTSATPPPSLSLLVAAR